MSASALPLSMTGWLVRRKIESGVDRLLCYTGLLVLISRTPCGVTLKVVLNLGYMKPTKASMLTWCRLSFLGFVITSLAGFG